MRAALPCLARFAALATILGLAGCAGNGAGSDGRSYHVHWTARTAKEKTMLASVVSPVVKAGGGELRVKTDSPKPEENRPAFPEFLAKIRPMKGVETVELQTRASVREVYRTKKGKLKISQRFIGALLPIRPGETLEMSGPADPIAIGVRLER